MNTQITTNKKSKIANAKTTNAKTTNPKTTEVKNMEPVKRNRKPAAKTISIEQHGPEVPQEMREQERREVENRRQANRSMQFATQQLTTPKSVAKTPTVQTPQLQTPTILTDKLQAMIEELTAAGISVQPTKVKKEVTPKARKQVENGITRPGENTKCGIIWAACDKISALQNRAAQIGELKLDASVSTYNDHTIKTQFARWRSFNGITGRAVAPVATI